MSADLQIRNILFATDFSEASHAAAQVAHAQARRWGAVLHLLHVCPEGDDPPRTALDDLASEIGGDVEVCKVCEVGKPADRILDYAARNGVDLIVLGTHGRTGMSRVLLGSVAERVMRLASCPVLTVPRLARKIVPQDEASAPAASEPDLGHCIVCGALHRVRRKGRGPGLSCMPGEDPRRGDREDVVTQIAATKARPNSRGVGRSFQLRAVASRRSRTSAAG